MSRSQKLNNSATHAGKQYNFSTPSERDAFLQTVNAASTIEELSDVTITSLAENEVLSYNGSEWVNAPGGGSSDGTIIVQCEALGTIPTGKLVVFQDFDGVDNMMRVNDSTYWSSAPDHRISSIVGVNNTGATVYEGDVFEVTMQGIVNIDAAFGIDGGNTTIYKGQPLFVSQGYFTYATAQGGSGISVGWFLEDLTSSYNVPAYFMSPRLRFEELQDGTAGYMSVREGAYSNASEGDLLIQNGYSSDSDMIQYRPYVQGVDDFTEVTAIAAVRSNSAGSSSTLVIHEGIATVPVEGGHAHYNLTDPVSVYTKVGTTGLTVEPASGEFVGFVMGASIRDGVDKWRIRFMPPHARKDDSIRYNSGTAANTVTFTNVPSSRPSSWWYFGYRDGQDLDKVYFVDEVDTSRAQNEIKLHTLATTDEVAIAVEEFINAALSPADTIQTDSQGLPYYKVDDFFSLPFVRVGSTLEFTAPSANVIGNQYAFRTYGNSFSFSTGTAYFGGGHSAGVSGKSNNTYTTAIAAEDLGAGHLVYQTGWDADTGLPIVSDNKTGINDSSWKTPLGIVDSNTLTASAVLSGSRVRICTSGLIPNAYVEVDPVTSLLPTAGATLCADAEGGSLLTRDNGSGLPVAIMIYPGTGTYDSSVWFTGGAKDSFLRSTGDGVRMGNTSRVSAVGNGVTIPAGVALKHSGAASNVAGKYTLFETGNAANLIVGLSATKSTGADTSADAFSLCTGGLVGSVVIKDAAGAVIGTATGAIEGQVVYTGDGTTNAAHVLTTDPTSGVAVGIVHEATKHGTTEPDTWTVLFQPSRLH